jgi:asparagine synthase (glutamine-hydrolysing)
MCGIAGVMSADGSPPDPAVLDALERALVHRGPDGHGRWVRNDVGLIQTRLAIIDLEGGRQPLEGPDGSGLALVANGEIYNYRELRAEYESTRFRTQSDCEPPLYLYRDEGPGFAQSLRGMYAIALHDPNAGRLVIARDPFGIKPLYFHEGARGFAFASEPQALIAAGLVSPRRATRATAELLQMQFGTGSDTLFEGICRVLPGETLVVEQGRVVDRRRISALPAGTERHAWSEDVALDQFDRTFMESVELHQRSDVPYGMFLSGGIDSSAVLAMMRRLNPTPVLAFTIGFPGTGAHDEREHAAFVAKAAGARHVQLAFTEADFWSVLPKVAAAMDDPACDYAILPTWKLAEAARTEVKVILSGEGGDELFGGYGRYRTAMRPWPLRRRMRRHGTFDGLGLLRDDPAGWRLGLEAAEREAFIPGRTDLQQAQAVDVADWLPNDLLTKLDRCLMAHGVEGRVPFLDPVLAEFAFLLPDRMKVHKRLGKMLLRHWLEKALPEAQPFARKRGFTVPVADWLARRPDLGDILARDEAIVEIARPDAVRKLFRGMDRKHGFAAWSLLFYALWHRRHIRLLPPTGDVFETLTN